MADFLTYRNENETIKERIKKMYQFFYAKYSQLPAAIIVNETELDAAREAIAALALGVPVYTLGGCLVPEVWLQLEAPEKLGAGLSGAAGSEG